MKHLVNLYLGRQLVSQFSMISILVYIKKVFNVCFRIPNVTSFRIVTAFSNFPKRTCLVCFLTLFWTQTKVLVFINVVRS